MVNIEAVVNIKWLLREELVEDTLKLSCCSMIIVRRGRNEKLKSEYTLVV